MKTISISEAKNRRKEMNIAFQKLLSDDDVKLTEPVITAEIPPPADINKYM